MDRAIAPLTVPVHQSSNSRLLFTGLNDVAKRTLDICAALGGLILLLPVFVLIGFLIRRDSPGPILYRGRRTGKNGREFGILKFRTMKECTESYRGARITAQNDLRVTPLGRRLRDTKVNELPQLWNVLKGEMSLVGPRPEDPEIVKTWPEAARHEILSVRPGITSPATVLYRDEESLLSSANAMHTYLDSVLPSKLRLDQLYVRHRSFWSDLDILFWTVCVLFPALRTFSPGEDLLFLGPISRFGRRYLNWFAIDTLITLIAIGLSGIVWRLSAPLDIGWLPALAIALGFAFLFSITGALLGTNRIVWSYAGARDAVGLVVGAVLAGSMALLANQTWAAASLLPPGMIIFAAALALTGFVSARYRSRLMSGFATRWTDKMGSARALRERVLIVGGGSTGQFIAWLLSNSNSAGIFRVIGFADDDLYKQGMRYNGIGVVGRRTDIPRLVERHDVGIIVFAIHNISSAERERVLSICRSTGARVVVVPDIVGTLSAVVSEKAQGEASNPKANGGEQTNATPLFTSQGIPPVQAQLWLADLERAAQSGDLAAVGDQIRSIREGIQRLGI